MSAPVADNRRAMLLMLAFAALWAAIEAIAAHVLHRYSPYQVVWTRYAVHIALMLAVWGWREPAALVRTRRPLYQLARSMLMLGMPASWVIGMQAGVHPATLMAVFWLSPLLILVLARVFGGERVHPAVWAAALAGYGGALLLHPPGRLEPLHLLVFPVAMALSFSLYVVMTRSLRGESVRANLFYTAFGVLIALTPAMPGLWITPPAADLAVMVAIGVLGYFALYALDRSAAAAPVSVPASFAYLQLVAFAGVAVLAGSGSVHSPRRMAVGALVIFAVAIYLWARESRLRTADGEALGAIR